MFRFGESVMAGVSLGVVVIFFLEGLGIAAEPMPVAEVEGEVITLGEVDAVLRQRTPLLNPPTAGQLRQLRSEVLGALIDERLLRKHLKAEGITVTPAEVKAQRSAFESALRKTQKSLADYLHESGRTEAQFLSDLEAVMQFDKYIASKISDADLQAHYTAEKDAFDGARVRVSHIVLRVGVTATPGERAEAKRKLEAYREEIVSEKTAFATAAAKHSQCPSASHGGDIGTITRRGQNVEEPFARAAFALKVGEISPVVETDFGLHLIRAVERIPGTTNTFEQVRDDVRDSLTERRRQELMTTLRKDARVKLMLP